MAVLKNRAKMSTSTTGTGTITLGSAEDGYQTFADAGVANADVVRYVIEDGNNFEIGTGTYTASGTTLTRSVSESNNSNNAINLSGSATVFISAIDEDIVGGPRGVEFDDNVKVKFGSSGGNELEIYTDGTSSYITESGSSHLNIQGQEIKFKNASGTNLMAMNSAQCELFFNGSKKMETTTNGIELSGNLDLGDNEKVRFGNSNDLEIYHTGAASIIEDTGFGPLHFKGSTSIDFFASNGEYMAYMVENGAVGLYHDGSQKLNTTSSGIQTTGTVNVNNAYTLPTSDGTNGQVLTTDGSGAVTFADAGGGGSPDLYADSANGSAVTPTANAGGSYNSVAIGNGADIGSGRGDSIAIGTDALTNQSQALAIGRSATVNPSGTWGTAVGRNSVVNGQSAVALGNSYASGTDSFAAVIDTNSSSYGASGTSSIAMGYHAKASANYAFAQGYESQALGNSDVALGYQAQANQGVALGYKGRATASRAFGVNNNTNGGATGSSSTAIGDSCLASGTGSVAIGFAGTADALGAVAIGRTPNVNGIRKLAYAVTSLSGNYDGSSQTGIQVLSAATTDATATALAAHGTASTNNQVILPNNSAYSFSGTIIARESAAAGSDYASWEIKGALLRDANAASTVLGNGIQNKLYATSGASAWAIALTADTTNGGLKIEVTGAASTNIRWVATVNTSEVTYA